MQIKKILPAFILSAIIASAAFAYQPQNPNGSATSANSSPVVIASDQAALPLPTGAATASAQTTGNSSLSTIATNTTNAATTTLQTTGNTSLSSIVTNTANIPAKGSATSANSTPVVIASDQAGLPLPSGASTSALQTTGNTSLGTIATNTTGVATAANQSTGNTSLSSIVTNTGRLPSQGSAVSASSLPVVIASDQAALPLPTGAATSAAQTTGNNSLATIVTNTGHIPATGQALQSGSLPVAISAPNIVASSVFTSPHTTSAYGVGQTVANSATAGSVTPLSFAIAPANGVPVSVIKARILTQTSGGAGPSVSTPGVFRLHLYGQSPTVAAGDGVTFSTTMVNWCGTLEGTLLQAGTDYSVAELVPNFGSFVGCAPAGGSQTIYGMLQAESAWTPGTSNSTYTVTIIAQ